MAATERKVSCSELLLPMAFWSISWPWPMPNWGFRTVVFYVVGLLLPTSNLMDKVFYWGLFLWKGLTCASRMPLPLLWDILWLLHCFLSGSGDPAGSYTTDCWYNIQLHGSILPRNSFGLPHASDFVLLLVITFTVDSA
jgi:hypothetical protein